MHSLVQEIALRMHVSPEKAEEMVSSVLIRVRAALDTIGEAEVEGLGTFRSVDGTITFEAAPELANEINKEFADMKPVALTPTGESVELEDDRAIPGVESAEGDGAEDFEVAEASSERTKPVPAIEEPIDTVESVNAEPESEMESTFESPPPPRPSKIRVPPRERRASRERAHERQGKEEIPDMGSVVTTRPVQPIHTGTPKRRRSGVPLIMAAAVVVLGVASWLILGTGGDESPRSQEVAATNASTPEPQKAPPQREPVAEQQPLQASQATNPVQTIVSASQATPQPEAEPASGDVASESEMAHDREEPDQETKGDQGPAPDEETAPAQHTAVESAPSVAQEAEPASSEPLSGPVYAWIVASYPSESEAANRRDKLITVGLDANVYQASVHGQPAFRVGVGRFGSEADALNHHDIVPPEVPDAWITRVK